MVCVWLQLQTTRRGVCSQKRTKTNKNKDDYCLTATNKQQWDVFSQDSRQTYKKTHEHRCSVPDCNYKERCFLRIQDKQTKRPTNKDDLCMTATSFVVFFEDRWQTKTEKDPQIKICAWLQLQTTRRGVCSSGQRTHEQDQRSCR